MRMFDRNPKEETEGVLEFIQPEVDETDTAMQYPHFEVDHLANAVYVTITDLTKTEIVLTKAITPSINADYDADGNVVGIEFLTMLVDFGEQFRWKSPKR